MRIAAIGGGTGLPVLLSGLKELRDAGEPLDITAIVTVADNGGSTGALRDAFKMPAMGDIRKCMIAMASEDSVLTSVCRHRFENPDGFAGHSLGNLILSALYQMSGDFVDAVRQAGELLNLRGRVLPSTTRAVTLCAMYEDGGFARGEANIPQPDRRIQQVWLEPAQSMSNETLDGQPLPRTAGPIMPPAAPGVLEALLEADAIVIGPGSLYTSIIPNLLVGGIADAIRESSAIKIYISNLMTQPGETDGYSAFDHLRRLWDYLTAIDVCVLNSTAPGTGVAERYMKTGSEIVYGTPEDEDEIRRMGVIPVAAPLLKEGEVKARHDSAVLARLVLSLARGLAGPHEIICSERNGR